MCMGGGRGGEEGDLDCQWTGYRSAQPCTIILATYIVLIKLTIELCMYVHVPILYSCKSFFFILTG